MSLGETHYKLIGETALIKLPNDNVQPLNIDFEVEILRKDPIKPPSETIINLKDI